MNKTVLVALALSAPSWLSGQTPAQNPAFDVATIKPNRTGHNAMGGRGVCLRGVTSVTNYSLDTIIQEVYDVKNFQLLGRPSWLGSETFDIEARSESPATYQQCQLMMKTLLADRFRLQVHPETRQMPIFRLMISKNGSKLHRIPDGAPTGIRQFMTGNTGRLDTRGTSMPQLARMLSGIGELENLVIDATGLEGNYEFILEWTSASLVPNSAQGPALTTALQEQLGLRLESGKGPVSVLVIDHVDRKPSEN